MKKLILGMMILGSFSSFAGITDKGHCEAWLITSGENYDADATVLEYKNVSVTKCLGKVSRFAKKHRDNVESITIKHPALGEKTLSIE